MVSIKRFINRSAEESALWEVILLLLENISSRAAVADQSECETFQAQIERSRDTIRSGVSTQSLLTTAGSVVQSLGDYNQRVTSFVRRQRTEFHSIVAMLSDVLAKTGGGNTRFINSFQAIGDSLEKAEAPEDLRALKLRLGECLDEFRDQSRQQKAEMENIVRVLQEEVGRSRGPAGGVLDFDKVTGLPMQAAAEAAFQEAIKAGKRRFVVTLVLNRLQPVNSRFGHTVGDEMLKTFKESVHKQLLPGDQMFRWTGPAIVALIDRAEPLDRVRAAVKRMLELPMEDTFDVGGRTVLIPISSVWSAFQLVPPLSITVKQIQGFIASQGSQDFA